MMFVGQARVILSRKIVVRRFVQVLLRWLLDMPGFHVARDVAFS